MLAAGTTQKRDDGTCGKRDGGKETKRDPAVVLRARGLLSEKVRVLGGEESRGARGERNEKECNKLAARLFSTCIKTSSGDGRLGKYCPTPSAARIVLSSFYPRLLPLQFLTSCYSFTNISRRSQRQTCGRVTPC